jgi:nucleoside phosphorylase
VALFAAFLPELAPLHGALGDAFAGRVGATHVVARAVGIGMPTAAAGAAAQIAELGPRAVVAIGTCGVYATRVPSSLRVGDVVVARRVRLADGCVAAGVAQFPEPMAVTTQAHPGLAEALARAGAHPADVGTTLSITTDDAAAARTAEAAGVQVEHLEAFGVAVACAARGVPFGAVLGVANTVGSRARDEWRAHHREAAAAAVRVVLGWLRGGATLP